MEIRSAYSEKLSVKTVNNEPTRTKQALAESLDVNNIIKRYNNTGLLPKAHNFEAMYGEFDSMDLQTAIEKVHRAEQLFLEVPSKIRAQFNNDAGAFIDFATNAENIEQMREWKMAPMPPEPAPEPAPEPEPDTTTE